MKDEKRTPAGQPAQSNGSLPNRILGSLRDALNAASRDDRTGEMSVGAGRDQVSGKAPPAEPQKPAAPPAAASRAPEIPVVAPQPVATRDRCQVPDARAKALRGRSIPPPRPGAVPCRARRRLLRTDDLEDPGRAGQAQGHAQRLPFRPRGRLAGGGRAGRGSARSGPSSRATMPSAEARTSASPSILVMQLSPRRSRLIFAMIRWTGRSCSCRTFPRPTSSR